MIYFLLQEFSELNIRYDGGIEFYDKKIISLIETFLVRHCIEYKNLSREEISELISRDREKQTAITNTQQSLLYTPRDYQVNIIRTTVDHLQKYNKCILALICGIGKSLISLWISQELRVNTIVIGVPNILLVNQWKRLVCSFFRDVPCWTTDMNSDIKVFLRENKNV